MFLYWILFFTGIGVILFWPYPATRAVGGLLVVIACAGVLGYMHGYFRDR